MSILCIVFLFFTLSGFNSPFFLNPLLQFLLILSVLFMYFSRFDNELIMKGYNHFCYILITFAFINLFLILFNITFFQPIFSMLSVTGYYSVLDSNVFRVTSLAAEPSQLAIYIVPFLLIKLLSFFQYKTYLRAIMLLAYFLIFLFTQSFLGYLTFFGVLLLKMKNFSILIVASIFFFQSLFLEIISKRYNQLINLFLNYDDLNLNNLNTTFKVYILAIEILKDNLKDNLLFGSGPFSYPATYDKYYTTYVDYDFIYHRVDAVSLYFRVLNEYGLVGFVLLLFFLYRLYRNILKYKLTNEMIFFLSLLFFWLRFGMVDVIFPLFYLFFAYFGVFKKKINTLNK